jgi:sec-independent protein translocase protein TatC
VRLVGPAGPEATPALDGRAEAPPAEELPRMGFFDHLDEFRRRLVVSLLALAVAFGVAWARAPWLFEVLARPVRRFLPPGQNLAYTTLTEPFLLYFRVALLGGLILASPVILSQLWLFIAPALYRREKRYAIPFLVASVFFFLAGCAFGYLQAFPVVVGFLVGMGTQFTAVITINEYLSTATKVIIGLGLCFELPILIFFLARMGVVSERWLLRKFKYAVLVVFVIAAVITPTPDVATQLVFAVPMLLLYLLGIGIAWVFRRRDRTGAGVPAA